MDEFAARVLKRAGFEFWPALSGQWVRLPFDMGKAWENEHASWAADMLAAARYPVHLDLSLRTTQDPGPNPPATRRPTSAMAAQPAPPAVHQRPRH